MKQQVLLIAGGEVFDSYQDYLKYLESREFTLAKLSKITWKKTLATDLPETDVIFPEMPNRFNAKYAEWKIWFDKIIPLLSDNSILVGHSLGAMFLVKYLAENTIAKKCLTLHLVGAPFDAEGTDESLGDFILPESLARVRDQVDSIFFYFSQDDPVVPFKNLKKYKEKLPDANYIVFQDRKHFDQLYFPEIIENIRTTLQK